MIVFLKKIKLEGELVSYVPANCCALYVKRDSGV